MTQAIVSENQIKQKNKLYNKKRILKDEIWLCKLPENRKDSKMIKGTRPCLVISNSIGNYSSGIVKVVPLTSNQNKGYLPTHVFLNKEDTGLKMDSYVLCEQDYTLEEADFLFKVGSINKNYYEDIDQAIMESIKR